MMNAYTQTHLNKVNLFIHGFAVPLFILAHVGLAVSVVKLKPLPALASVGLIALSLGLQRQGHSLERQSPPPFKNGADFAYRLYREQFYTFPRFVLSGRFNASIRASAASSDSEIENER